MAVTALTLRPMTPEDLEAVLALEQEIFSRPWTEGILRDELAAPRRTYLVAEEGGSPVGYGGMMTVADEGHITNLAVAPAARGRGIATRLLLDLAEGALDAGTQHLTLEVRLSNAGARRLYGRFGFAPVAIRKDYYVDDDALIMWVVDAAEPEYRARLAAIREGLR